MKKQILCFGDSNTWGFNAVDESRFSEGIRWTGVLASLLGENYKVIEEGLSGRTAVIDDPLFEGLNGLSYINPCIRSHSPLELVIIMLGTNDTKERFHLTAYNIAQGILRLAKKAREVANESNEKQVKILIVCPPVIGSSYLTSKVGAAMGVGCDIKSVQLHPHLAKLSSSEQIEYLDASHIPMNEIDFMHLTEGGHKLLGELVFNKVKQLI